MNFEDRFVASDDVVSREVGGEMVLLDLGSGQYFGLDPVGSRIWQLLTNEPCALAAICDVIEAEFDGARDQIEADIAALAQQLVEKQLIVAAA